MHGIRQVVLGVGVACVVASAAVAADEAQPRPTAKVRRGAPVSEPGLKDRKDILFFEDFEADNWIEVWNNKNPVGFSKDAQTASGPGCVFMGKKALKVLCKKGRHESVGSGGVYFPEGMDVSYVRWYIKFPENWVQGTGPSGGMKMIGFEGLRSGVTSKPTSAGVKPKGDDKFSCRMCTRPKTGDVVFYYYHPDQRKGYGDAKVCDIGGPSVLTPGKWHCLEARVKVNTVGQKDGEIKFWLNGELKGEVTGLRFRDVEDLKIRKARMDNYWGGAGDENTCPVDQEFYVDNFAVSSSPIGPAAQPPPEK